MGIRWEQSRNNMGIVWEQNQNNLRIMWEYDDNMNMSKNCRFQPTPIDFGRKIMVYHGVAQSTTNLALSENGTFPNTEI